MSKTTSVTHSTAIPARTRLWLGLAWTLGLIVCLLSIISWGRYYGWHLLPFSVYLWFPVLGLLAFSLMWTHYIVGTLGGLLKLPKGALASYFRVTGYAVLVLICLHPGLLIYQRFRDGYGLPPHSYESYVAPGLGWVTVLGTASLLVFLAFEFHRVLGQRRWWHYVVDASDFAMLAIVYHALRLGQQVQHGWFRAVWFFYAASLIAVLIYKYYKRFRQKFGGTAK
jgi:hypothetical protein